jgi:2-polyprenyl-3-methyl-5-hydroxy-6-metoxy-1,4-benzoquinol methylase/uncharacterized protein YbaR (Trm112 family)
VNRALLDYLVCPDCQHGLDCRVTDRAGKEIETGELLCSQCGKHYPIVRGVPRFVTVDQPLSGENVRTANAFGWEWQEFRELHDLGTYRTQFLDWIYPIEPSFFEDKVMLDAGCGMGRFSLVSSTLGARMVLAVDASAAVEAARENARDFPGVEVIQGDILHLPLRRGQESQMDFVFSIGVLHHLDEPQAGFSALAQHIQPGGSIFAWVYGRENNGWLVNIVNPLRKLLTSRLPRSVLYLLSLCITVVLHPVLKLVYRPANRKGAPAWLRKVLPYNDYLAWLSGFGFRHSHHVVFDHLVAPVAYYIRRQEFERWFKEADLDLVDLSWRNQNSWRGHGGSRRSVQ